MADQLFKKKKAKMLFEREEEKRSLKEKILIVCEGKKTEPNYFRAFPVNPEIVEVQIEGEWRNTRSLVEEAIRLKTQKSYNQVWCVFDRDSFPADNFKMACNIAENQNIRVAYSNEAFEIWYLLHFNYHTSALSRKQYQDKLTESLGITYKKNDETMYNQLQSSQKTTIKNAERLWDSYREHNPEKDNPSTTVHLLVNTLNEFIVK